MFRRKRKDEEIDLIELSKEEIRENEKQIWGYTPEWRKTAKATDLDFVSKKKITENKIKNEVKDLNIEELKPVEIKIKNLEEDLKKIDFDYSEVKEDSKDNEKETEVKEESETKEEVEVKKEAEVKEELEVKKEAEKPKVNSKLSVKTIVARIALCLVTAAIFIIVAILGVVLIIEHGPSKYARNLFVNSVMETSAGKFLATSFVSASEIEKIKAENSVEAVDDVTDTSLIKVASDEGEVKENADANESNEAKDIELIKINGGAYNGYLLKIADPSRVSVATCGEFGGYGKHTDDIGKNVGAIAAINGGGFVDENGMGAGGTPLGIVISNGQFLYGEKDKSYDIAGFDNNNVLVVGSMTGQEAIDRGIRDCCCYGPTLIVNGEATTVKGTGSGLNPRTAIGQCADGTVLLLVIDGRQINSIGATFADIIDVMLEYGAVNAYNLDGGSSTTLYYNGEVVNSAAPVTGSRLIPTAFVVK